jgi:hypothetical protein
MHVLECLSSCVAALLWHMMDPEKALALSLPYQGVSVIVVVEQTVF